MISSQDRVCKAGGSVPVACDHTRWVAHETCSGPRLCQRSLSGCGLQCHLTLSGGWSLPCCLFHFGPLLAPKVQGDSVMGWWHPNAVRQNDGVGAFLGWAQGPGEQAFLNPTLGYSCFPSRIPVEVETGMAVSHVELPTCRAQGSGSWAGEMAPPSTDPPEQTPGLEMLHTLVSPPEGRGHTEGHQNALGRKGWNARCPCLLPNVKKTLALSHAGSVEGGSREGDGERDGQRYRDRPARWSKDQASSLWARPWAGFWLEGDPTNKHVLIDVLETDQF